MEQKLFSITCVTCQARLAVRAAAAIGTVLECPRCQSMVHVVPPEGWAPPVSTAPSESASQTASPPPLNRVATGPLPLDLDPVEVASSGSSYVTWLAASGAALVVMAALLTLPRLLSSPSATAPMANATTSTVSEAATDTSGKPKPSPAPPQATADAYDVESPKPAAVSAATKTDSTPNQTASTISATPSAPLVGSTTSTLPTASEASRPPEPKPTPPDPFAGVVQEPEPALSVEIKKTPPTQVDVTARLSQPVPRIQFSDMPLAKVVELVAAIGGLPVTIDVDALMQLGVTPHDSVSLDVSGVSVAKALQAAAATKGLAMVVDNGQVLITTPTEYREALRNIRYTVTDLLDGEKATADELAMLVQKLVAPATWQAAGGRGTIAAQQGTLVVVQTSDVHQQVLVFCEKLRNARHKALRSRGNPERFTLATRRHQARPMLDHKVTLNFHDPAPLAKILACLADATGADILVDHAALAAAETSDRVDATLTAQKQPLAAALTELLRPLGLTYRAAGPGVIQVTTTEAAEELLELEIYPVAARLSGALSGPTLAERLKSRVAATTWSDVGGPAEVYFDPPSQCLIVLQSQPAQAAIEGLLERADETTKGQ